MRPIGEYCKRIREELNDPIYVMMLVGTLLIAFGYEMFHLSVNIDTLFGATYIGSGNRNLSIGRFGTTFWFRVFGITIDTSPVAMKAVAVFSVLVLMISGLLFAALFSTELNIKSRYGFKLFSLVVFTYPLIAESWSYPELTLELPI